MATPGPGDGAGGEPSGDEPGPLRAAFSGLTTRGRSFLAAGAAALGCAYLLGQEDLLRVGALLVVLPVVAVLVLHRTRNRVTAARRVDPVRMPAGEEGRVRLQLSNDARLPSGMLMLQDHVPYVLGPKPRFTLERIEPGGRREVTYRIRSDLRGRYPLGPLQLRLADPFGMVELTRSYRTRSTLTVLPPVEPLPPVRFGGLARGDGVGTRRSLASAGEDDLIPREYRHGDDLRRVHWRSTAHRGALMVRREEAPRRARCTVLLDTRRAGYVLGGAAAPFERAVAGAASALAHLTRQGYEVRLLTDDGTQLPETGGEAADPYELTGRLLDFLAVVDYADSAGFEPALAARPVGGDELLLAFLGSVDPVQAGVLGRMAAGAGGAAAFVVAGQLDPYVEEQRLNGLRGNGWTALPHHPGVPLGTLWQRAAVEVAAPGGGRG
ncbi:Uncharacterized conserved protein, DUF58 family, contains vWF domain [Streptomyces zhaozhouensis]|uniref:Uncharacterized conserved protein, DUF58 family, contains vWF domain n=1 Tax=Streptomyces zhaozhouensis TaxID=1300267 RepID=A0A286DJE5_9ACTN|nr:DUF58 domain-containing protein [Streptomyces zhaozhouensis]SOD58703.1 Uncharacterized conserved protein, DUF58 family, contains vWF domain [Streptomyces zhaozhouensis]